MEPPYIPKDVHPEAYQNYQEIVEKLQRECKGEFKDINAFTDHINHGLDSLKELICKRIAGLKIAKNDVEAVQHMISTQVLLWPHFQNAIDQVVEVWGLIWAYRTDGEIAWSLKVIWDSDRPEPSTGILPHYGYEVHFNNKRAGPPGHVYMTDTGPDFSRDGQPMHEVERRGPNCDQKYGGKGGSQKPVEQELRLDYAFRHWVLGADGEIAHELGLGEAYKKAIERPPPTWYLYETPCFGVPRGAKY